MKLRGVSLLLLVVALAARELVGGGIGELVQLLAACVAFLVFVEAGRQRQEANMRVRPNGPPIELCGVRCAPTAAGYEVALVTRNGTAIVWDTFANRYRAEQCQSQLFRVFIESQPTRKGTDGNRQATDPRQGPEAAG